MHWEALTPGPSAKGRWGASDPGPGAVDRHHTAETRACQYYKCTIFGANLFGCWVRGSGQGEHATPLLRVARSLHATQHSVPGEFGSYDAQRHVVQRGVVDLVGSDGPEHIAVVQ